MNLRLRKSLAAAWLLISISFVASLQATETRFEISYVPDVVFKGTPLTIQLRAPRQTTIQVTIDDVVQQAVSINEIPLHEITLFPEKTQELGFRCAATDREWTFEILEPGFEGNLQEKDGYLYLGEFPVILMPVHRLPPLLDRRWETVDLVENLIQNQKTRIRSMKLFTSADSDLSAELKTLFPRVEIGMQFPDPTDWFRVHGYLTATGSPPSKFIAIEMDLFDFERGMSPQTWFMKWQFLLQDLQLKNEYTDGLLFGPVYSPATLKWKSVLEEKLKGLAAAHGLRYIDRSFPQSIWQERLLNRLGKTYQLP